MSGQPEQETACTCELGGCDGEGYDDGDPRTCRYCASMDGEWPCPADPETSVVILDVLMVSVNAEGFEPVVECVDGSEPFASYDLGGGWVLDLTATQRSTAPSIRHGEAS